MTEEVQALLANADRALEAARVLIEHGMKQDAAEALLRQNGIEVSKHSAVESALGYHFVRAGKMDPSFHRQFINARKVREFVDYGIIHEAVEPRLDLGLDEGRTFIAEMKRLIGA